MQKPSPRGVSARGVAVNESRSRSLTKASGRRGDNRGTEPAAKPAARSRGFRRVEAVRAGEAAPVNGGDAKATAGCVRAPGLAPALAFRGAGQPLSLTPESPRPPRGRWRGRCAVQVVPLAAYTCFSRRTVHLTAQRDLQFHTSHGAGGERFACAFLRLGLIWSQLPFDGNARPEALSRVCPVRKIWKSRHLVLIAAIAG